MQLQDRLPTSDRYGAAGAIGEFRMWPDAQAVIDGGDGIARRDRLVDRIGALPVGSSIDPPAGAAAAGYHDRQVSVHPRRAITLK